MTGVSSTHNRICTKVEHLLVGLNPAQGNCLVYPSDKKLQVGDEKVYYRNVLVVCQGELPNEFYKSEPCILVEVLSPGTKDLDRH